MRTTNSMQLAVQLKKGQHSIAELVQATGLSYSTVVRGIEALGAVLIPGTYPKEWTLDPKISDKVVPLVAERPDYPSVAEKGSKAVLVTLREEPDWVSKWNKAREQFGRDVAKLSLEEGDNPASQAIRFASAARDLASIALAVSEVADKPEWYELLGGKVEKDLPTKATDVVSSQD